MPHDKICEHCGKPFVADKSTRRFCSYACSGASRRKPKAVLICEGCGKRFQVKRAYRASEAQYCSQRCYLEHARNWKTCPTCGREFYGHNQIYCSHECVSASQRTRIMRTCPICNTIFEVAPYVIGLGQGIYCSGECAREAQKRTRVQVQCEVCGKLFEVTPSQLQYRTPRFCSQDCWRRYSGETLPEAAVREALTELGIPFKQQHPILRYHLDFFLPNQHIDLEVDGTYWHSLRPDRDARRDKRLLRRGIRTIRITDSELSEADDVAKLLHARLLE